MLLETNSPLQYTVGFLLLLVYAGSLFFPLMDKDAAHHANIALYMYEQNNWYNLVDRQKDYLDKPHFLFWSSLLSFKLFGVSTFAHRLPGLLFSILSVYSTYKLARHLTDRTTAKLAALLLATAQAFVLSVIDARMETPLTAFIIFGLWQLILYIDTRTTSALLLAALGAAVAFSTKGWIGPIVIFISAFFYLLISKKWIVFAQLKTWLFVPLFFLFISPVLYAYYLQFDLHPEKMIRGRTGHSGIRFILWDQLFERSQGFDQGHEGRNSDYFFLFHTFLWAFSPWSILAGTALFFWIRRMLYKKKWRGPVHFAAVAFAFILFAISFSKFKMPHYIIMMLPLAALFTAPWIRYALPAKGISRILFPVQVVFAIVTVVLIVLLNYYFFPVLSPLLHVAGGMLLFLLVLIIIKKFNSVPVKIICMGTASALALNFFLNYNYFPRALRYQAGNVMVEKMKEAGMNISKEDIVLVELHAHSFDFYRGHNHQVLEAADFPTGFENVKNKYFLLTPFLVRYLEGNGYRIHPVMTQPDYNISRMQLGFLNPATRHTVMDTLLLARITPNR